jgi:hypothetical protein
VVPEFQIVIPEGEENMKEPVEGDPVGPVLKFIHNMYWPPLRPEEAEPVKPMQAELFNCQTDMVGSY